MKYIWIDNIDDFKDISKKWDDVLQRMGDENPFLLSSFIITWWRHYSSALKLRIFVVFDKDDISGGVPLCLNKSGRLEHVGGLNANYTQLLSLGNDREIWQALLEALKEAKDWRILKLRRYKETRLIPGGEELKRIASRYRMLLDIPGCEESYLTDIPSDFSAYQSLLPKKLRYYVKRAIQKSSELGEICLYQPKTIDEIDSAADRFIEFSRTSFKIRNEESSFENCKYCLFFKEILREFSRIGRLDANILKLNGVPAAIHFGFMLTGAVNYIFTAFDIKLAALNPGHLLIYKLIEAGSGRKSKIFDMYTGHRFYKEQWSNRREKVLFIELRPDSIASRIDRTVSHVLRRAAIVKKAKDIIKRSPGARRLARGIRNLIQKYI